MPHTVQVAPVASRDKFGKPTYGADVSYQGRVVEKVEHLVIDDGREVVSSHVLYLAPHAVSGIPDLTPEARVTLPDATTPMVLRINVYPDEDGDAYWQVWLGSGTRAG